MAGNRSRTRRTRVVPNRSYDHRPSSSMAGGRPSHFFKIILPSTIDDKKLRIPENFVREFGDELSAVATLTVPCGNFWRVGLEKANKEIWFHDGWQDFMEYHSVHYGYFLVFRYDGNSKFHVLVFDNTATEIEYTRSKDCELIVFDNTATEIEYTRSKDCELKDTVDDAKKSRHDKLKENEMSDEVDRGTSVRERFSGTSLKGRRLMVYDRRERAIQAARMLKPKSPSFTAILGRCQEQSRRRNSLYVPRGFARRYLFAHHFVELQTCDGKHWRAPCVHNISSSAMTIAWGKFSKDNNVKDRDVCVFELIQRNPAVLKVSIFHADDYAVN